MTAEVRHAVYLESQDALIERFSANTPPTVWAYLRAGTAKEHHVLPEFQHAVITKYAEQQKLDAPVFVLDKEESSHPRPLLLRLLSHITSVKNSCLLVWKMDRLSDSVGEQECILWILDRTGVKLQAVTGSPTNDPFSDAIRKAFAAIHLYQTALTSVKENPGLLLKSLHGKWTGGTPPFGYKAENGELVIEEYEAKMVRYIFFLHSHYPMNTRQIGAHIEVNKVMTDVCKYTTRKVFKILAHERLYRGEYRDCYGVVHPRPDLKILPDTKDELKALHIKDPADEHQINA